MFHIFEHRGSIKLSILFSLTFLTALFIYIRLAARSADMARLRFFARVICLGLWPRSFWNFKFIEKMFFTMNSVGKRPNSSQLTMNSFNFFYLFKLFSFFSNLHLDICFYYLLFELDTSVSFVILLVSTSPRIVVLL